MDDSGETFVVNNWFERFIKSSYLKTAYKKLSMQVSSPTSSFVSEVNNIICREKGLRS